MDKTLLVANVKRYTARYMPSKLCSGADVTSAMDEAHFDSAALDASGSALGVIGSGERQIAVFAEIGSWGLSSAISGIKAAYEADMLPQNSTVTLVAVPRHGALTAGIIDSLTQKRAEIAFFTGASGSRAATAHRARDVFEISVRGVCDIGSESIKAHNAIYMASEMITDIRMMNTHLAYDERMGKGFIAPIGISTKDDAEGGNDCVITLERLYSKGETKEKALEALKDMASVKRAGAKVFEAAACGAGIYNSSALEHVMSESDPIHTLMLEAEERYYGDAKRAYAASDANMDAVAASGVPIVTIGPDGVSGAYDAAGMLACALEAMK